MPRTPRALAPLGLVALLATLAGCGDDPASTPDAATTDVPVSTDIATADISTDSPSIDAPLPDGDLDASTQPDATTPDIPVIDIPEDRGPPPPACETGALVDLAAVASPDGGVTRYAGNTDAAPRAPSLPASCVGSDGRGDAVHQVVHRYVPRINGRLRVSLDDEGTDPAFDTILFAQRVCFPLRPGEATLGCNDDVEPAVSRPRASEIVTARVTAGTPVYLVVAGYPHSEGEPLRGHGAYVLTVRELPEVNAGDLCDPTGAENACAPMHGCLSIPDGAMPRCAADGTADARCREGGGERECDASLRCVNGRCRRTLAAGAACGPSISAVCPEEYSCQWSTRAHRCVATGTRDADCRDDAPRCNTGLACVVNRNGNNCRASVASGAACDPYGVDNACATGLGCALSTPGANGMCVPLGTMVGAPCRDGTSRCDGALVCEVGPDGFTERCVASASEGAACDPSGGTSRCPSGVFCAPNTGFTTGTCAANGTVAGSACRGDAPRCDGALVCSRTEEGVCQRALAAGEACDLRWASTRCTDGGCVATSTTAGACRPDVTETEPNDTPATATAFVDGVSMTGALSTSDVMDCARVTASEGQSLVVEVSTSDDRVCERDGGDPAVSVYDPSGAEVVREDDTPGRGLCATVAPWTHPEVRAVAAGVWTACVRRGTVAIPRYRLTVGLLR